LAVFLIGDSCGDSGEGDVIIFGSLLSSFLLVFLGLFFLFLLKIEFIPELYSGEGSLT